MKIIIRGRCSPPRTRTPACRPPSRASGTGRLDPPGPASAYMRNLLGWLGTRLAQNALTYINITSRASGRGRPDPPS